MAEATCENCEHRLEAQDPVICAGCYEALAAEAREARRFYVSDGSFVEMDPTEVRRRRIGAAQNIVELQERLARLVETERDRLAAMAMQGLLAAGSLGMPEPEEIARLACRTADALLAEREKGAGRG